MAGKKQAYADRMAWFHEARFGMFIHWGLYSLLGRGEWVMLEERIAHDEYRALADRFTPAKFDATVWADLAVQAGMKYAVFTTRHHEGFCLFDSQVSDFTSVKAAAGRDFVADYVAAFRAAGLKVGFYYSLLDWRFPGYFEPKKYKKSAEAMVEQAHHQVRELMTNYGPIDILWYDGGWLNEKKAGKSMAKFWRSKALNAMVRELQPNILINNRSGIEEDLDTPEQHVTASQPGRGWESCMTMGDSNGWGYIHHNPNFKSVTQLLQNLCIAAAGEGNYLLNVGPKPDGTIRKEERDRLAAMGAWLQVNGDAIYGSQRCELLRGMNGLWTRKGNTAYYCVFHWPGEETVIPYVKPEAVSAQLLGGDRRLTVRHEYNGRLVIGGLPKAPPDKSVSVIRVDFDGKPKRLEPKNDAAWIEGKA